MKKLLLLSAVLIASACAVGPDYTPPAAQDTNWHSTLPAGVSTAAPLAAWWEGFHDPALDDLILEAAANNHDVRIALANIKQARALRRAAASDFYPAVRAGASGERQGLSSATSSNRSNAERERDSYDAGLDAAWELDLFGRVQRATEAADADLAAAEANRQDVMLSVLAEVARNYFEVRGLQKRIAVTERNIALLAEVESVAEARYKNGASSGLDLARARAAREAVAATLPALEADMKAGIHRISVLTGQNPEAYLALLSESKPLPAPPDLVPVGLRSELLRRRPDIRIAERSLAAATARIGVAETELFPRISLTGNVGTSARMFSDLFTSGGFNYAFGGLVDWPLLQGGKLRADIAAAEAGAEGRLAAYEQTVLKAFEETENALTRYGREWQSLKSYRTAAKAQQEAFEIAKLRYESGEDEFLILLDAERQLVEAEDNQILSETRILTHLTQLYKTLGGGWENFEN